LKLTPQFLAEVVNALSCPPAAAGKGAEKRRAARMEVEGNVVVAPLLNDGTIGQSFTAVTRDISFVGIGLLQSKRVALGDRIVVRLPRGTRDALFVHCKVQHVRPLADGLYVIGAEFAGMSGIKEEDMLGRAADTVLHRVRELILN